MLVFIDDSGDPGFKTEEGSSQHFVIALVIFKDELEAENAAVAIKNLRRILEFPDSVEFKFHKSRKDVRLQFLETVRVFDFSIRCIVIDKNVVYSEKLKTDRTSFYNYAMKLVLKNSGEMIQNAKIRVDGRGDRNFRRGFQTYIRRELPISIMKDCKLVNSKGNVLIQLADMIAGSVRRSYDMSKTDRTIYKEIIADKIPDRGEWIFQ